MLKRYIVELKHIQRNYSFVPKHKPPSEDDYEILRQFIQNHNNILILTGAGISTESGIPDYRSEKVGLYAKSNHKPILYQDFVKYPKARQRYWARNFVGWPRFSQIQPNATHAAITNLQKEGKVTSIVTQNVDRLHQKASSTNVIELHGSSYLVKCLNCTYEVGRAQLQQVMTERNPDMQSTVNMIRPDGDVELSQVQVESFQVPLCPRCNGPLKPDIIFFGDNVPKERVEVVRQEVSRSDSILVLGSSLTVYSSYRIILQGKEEWKNIAILNIGPTRADDLAHIKISTKCGDLLPRICSSF